MPAMIHLMSFQEYPSAQCWDPYFLLYMTFLGMSHVMSNYYADGTLLYIELLYIESLNDSGTFIKTLLY